jgi:hypothetical protein
MPLRLSLGGAVPVSKVARANSLSGLQEVSLVAPSRRRAARKMRRRRLAQLVCAVCIAVLILVLALPSPWGLGAFEPNRPLLTISSFRIDTTPLPSGPPLNLTLENSGDSLIVLLLASLGPALVPGGLTLNFPSVNATSPLAPGQYVSGYTVLHDDNMTCGSVYTWSISGIFSSGSEFGLSVGARLSCTH